MKGILEFLAKNNRWAILLVILLIIIGSGIYNIQRNKIGNLNNKYQTEVNLKNSLLDSINVYQNKEGEWVTEKLTIQIKLTDLEKMNGQLSNGQKKLLNRIKFADKKNSIITAALIQANFVIDSLKHGGIVVVDTVNKTVNFIELKNPDIKYNFLASGVLPFPPNIKPMLFINNLTLPNVQFIEFHWTDNKKEGNPIAFSVTNSNKYVKVYDVNSYAIPTIEKDILNPTSWQKVGIWIKKNDEIFKFIGGVVIGVGGTFIVMK